MTYLPCECANTKDRPRRTPVLNNRTFPSGCRKYFHVTRRARERPSLLARASSEKRQERRRERAQFRDARVERRVARGRIDIRRIARQRLRQSVVRSLQRGNAGLCASRDLGACLAAGRAWPASQILSVHVAHAGDAASGHAGSGSPASPHPARPRAPRHPSEGFASRSSQAQSGLSGPMKILDLACSCEAAKSSKGKRARVRCRESAPERNPESNEKRAPAQGAAVARARARTNSGSRPIAPRVPTRRTVAIARTRGKTRAGHGRVARARGRRRRHAFGSRVDRLQCARARVGRRRCFGFQHHGGRESPPGARRKRDCRMPEAVGVKSSIQRRRPVFLALARQARFGDVLAASPRRGRARAPGGRRDPAASDADAFAEITSVRDRLRDLERSMATERIA